MKPDLSYNNHWTGNYHVQLTGINGWSPHQNPSISLLKSPVGTISLEKVYSDVNANTGNWQCRHFIEWCYIDVGTSQDTTALGIMVVNITAGMATIETDTPFIACRLKILTTNLTTSLVGCDDEKTLIFWGINCISQNKITNYLLCPGVMDYHRRQGSEWKRKSPYIKTSTRGCADTFHLFGGIESTHLGQHTVWGCLSGVKTMVPLLLRHRWMRHPACPPMAVKVPIPAPGEVLHRAITK